MSVVPGPSAAEPAGDARPVNQTVMKAAQDFESMAIGQLLEPMFATVDTASGPFGGGAGEENFKPMLVTEMAKEVERGGGFGLASAIYQQMIRMQEGGK